MITRYIVAWKAGSRLTLDWASHSSWCKHTHNYKSQTKSLLGFVRGIVVIYQQCCSDLKANQKWADEPPKRYKHQTLDSQVSQVVHVFSSVLRHEGRFKHNMKQSLKLPFNCGSSWNCSWVFIALLHIMHVSVIGKTPTSVGLMCQSKQYIMISCTLAKRKCWGVLFKEGLDCVSSLMP